MERGIQPRIEEKRSIERKIQTRREEKSKSREINNWLFPPWLVINSQKVNSANGNGLGELKGYNLNILED